MLIRWNRHPGLIIPEHKNHADAIRPARRNVWPYLEAKVVIYVKCFKMSVYRRIHYLYAPDSDKSQYGKIHALPERITIKPQGFSR